MKKILLSLLTIFIIQGCSQNSESESSTSSFVEYVWHTAGPDFSSDNLAKLISDWNSIITYSGCDMDGANILTPLEASPDYDFIWVLLWPSKDSRDACWSDWMANYDADWRENISGIMDFDGENAYLFQIKPNYMPKVQNTSGSFTNRFNFCNYNEGHSESSLEEFSDSIRSVYFTDSYWNVLLEPQFEPEAKPDFVWLDLWASLEDKDKAYNIYLQNESLTSMSEEMFTCQYVDFAGTVIRS